MAVRPVKKVVQKPDVPPIPESLIDPTAPLPTKEELVETAPVKRDQETCEVRPVHGFPIYAHRQGVMIRPEVWTLVRRDSWIDTQVSGKILVLR